MVRRAMPPPALRNSARCPRLVLTVRERLCALPAAREGHQHAPRRYDRHQIKARLVISTARGTYLHTRVLNAIHSGGSHLPADSHLSLVHGVTHMSHRAVTRDGVTGYS